MSRNCYLISFEYTISVFSIFSLFQKWKCEGREKGGRDLNISVCIPIFRLNLNFGILISLKILWSWFHFGWCLLGAFEFQSSECFNIVFWGLFQISINYLCFKCIRILKSEIKDYFWSFHMCVSNSWGAMSTPSKYTLMTDFKMD